MWRAWRRTLQRLTLEQEWTPIDLLKTFRYGDLIHWDEPRRDLIDPHDDAARAVEQRYAFLIAALGWCVRSTAKRGAAKRAWGGEGAPSGAEIAFDFEPPGPPVGD